MLSDGKRVTIQGGPFVVHAQVWRELNFDTRVGVSRAYVMLEPDDEHRDYDEERDEDDNKLKLTPREARRIGRMLIAAADDAVCSCGRQSAPTAVPR